MAMNWLRCFMNDTTDIATITEEEILLAEQEWTAKKEGFYELERFLGTVETYGGYINIKPNLSKETL